MSKEWSFLQETQPDGFVSPAEVSKELWLEPDHEVYCCFRLSIKYPKSPTASQLLVYLGTEREPYVIISGERWNIAGITHFEYEPGHYTACRVYIVNTEGPTTPLRLHEWPSVIMRQQCVWAFKVNPRKKGEPVRYVSARHLQNPKLEGVLCPKP